LSRKSIQNWAFGQKVSILKKQKMDTRFVRRNSLFDAEKEVIEGKNSLCWNENF
jgi:hypothetical protein